MTPALAGVTGLAQADSALAPAGPACRQFRATVQRAAWILARRSAVNTQLQRRPRRGDGGFAGSGVAFSRTPQKSTPDPAEPSATSPPRKPCSAYCSSPGHPPLRRPPDLADLHAGRRRTCLCYLPSPWLSVGCALFGSRGAFVPWAALVSGSGIGLLTSVEVVGQTRHFSGQGFVASPTEVRERVASRLRQLEPVGVVLLGLLVVALSWERAICLTLAAPARCPTPPKSGDQTVQQPGHLSSGEAQGRLAGVELDAHV